MARLLGVNVGPAILAERTHLQQQTIREFETDWRPCPSISQPIARRGLWPQMEDQRATYQPEGDTRRSKGNEHGRRKTRKNNNGSSPGHATGMRGDLRGFCAHQYLAL